MIKKLLFTLLGTATLSVSAQLNATGDGFTLDNTNGSSSCYVNLAPGTGGHMNGNANTFVAGSFQTVSTLELTSVASIPAGPIPHWFSIPVTVGTGAAAQCSNLNAQSSGINMTSNSKVTITAQASAVGDVLEFFLGGEGQWNPASSTYNTGNAGATIKASHTFATANADETFTFDFATLGATEWTAWTGKDKIQSLGYSSATGGAAFKINKVELGADASGTPGGGTGTATCSDGVQNQDETGIDCGGASCSPCGTTGGGTGNGVACATTKDDGQAQATFYNLIANGTSNVVTCQFDVQRDVKGTKYGALETATLHGNQAKTAAPAKYCGMCVEMTGVKGTAIVRVVDECPDCKDHNVGDTDIDLSPAAFDAIVGPSSIGRSNITWFEVSCPMTTPISLMVESGHEWSIQVIIENHVNRIEKVEIRSDKNTTWAAMTRTTANQWSKGSMSGKIKDFKITDIYGSEIIMASLDFSTTHAWKRFDGTEQFPACGLTTSTNEVSSLNYVSAYPNPATSSVTFAGINGATEIQIVNLVGNVVATQSLNGSTDEVSLNIAGLTAGLYVAKITNGSGVFTKTFVKK